MIVITRPTTAPAIVAGYAKMANDNAAKILTTLGSQRVAHQECPFSNAENASFMQMAAQANAFARREHLARTTT